MQILPVFLCLVALISSSTVYAAKSPCDGNSLKKWASKAGYPTDYCQNSGGDSTETNNNTSTETRDPCRSDGTLTGWARKSNYDPAICVATSNEEEPPTEVTNTAPAVVITSPSNGATIEQGQSTQLTADVSDAEDGSNLSLQWLSSMEGSIADLSSLSVGEHTITATVTDSEGLSSSQQIAITVIEPAPPTPTTESATLSWQPPTTRSNGEALLMSEIKGYEIYMIEDSGNQEAVITVNGSDITSHTFGELTSGLYHFAIATIDTSNLVSEISASVSLSIQ